MRTLLRTLPVIWLLLWPVSVASPQDEPLLDRAKRLYREGRFSEAAQQLSAAATTMEDVSDTPARVARLADAYLHLGLSYAALNELALAKEAFKSLLALQPGYDLNPDIYAPKIIDLLEQARLAATAMVPRAETVEAVASATEPAARLSIESGSDLLRHVHIGSAPAPTPAFTRTESEESYRLPLRAAASGITGDVGVRVASRSDRDRLIGRFRWGTLRDATAVESRATALSHTKELSPPAADGGDVWRVRTLDLLWSRRLTTSRRPAMRLEIGYRYLQAQQATVYLLRDSRCASIAARVCFFDSTAPRVTYIRRELQHRDSRVHDHGLHLGADVDWSLRKRWHVVARAGLALMTVREQGQTYWEVTDKPEKDPFLRWYEDIPRSSRWHLAYDLSVGVRAPLGRRCSVAIGSQLQDVGPGSRITPNDRRQLAGLWLRLTYALVY